MIVQAGEKLHVIYRALYEDSNRRHFLGEVEAAEGAVCRLLGYVFIYDKKSTICVRKPEKRTTIMDLGESGYVVNLIDGAVNPADVACKYQPGVGLIATDGRGFVLNINELGLKS